ncbi:MAG: hypothetical protein ABEJ43_03495 [Haloferacaceae archaeon]
MRSPARFLRLALAVALLPHELVHFLVLAPWSRGLGVRLAPPLDETRGVPLARVSGQFDPGVPLPVLRLAAVAPTLWYPLVALSLGQFPLSAPVALAATALLSAWAVPSAGDLTVFLDAAAVREAGSLDARGPSPRLADPLSALLAVVVTLVVAGAVLGPAALPTGA